MRTGKERALPRVERRLQEGVECVRERYHLRRIDPLDGLGEPPVTRRISLGAASAVGAGLRGGPL